MPKTLGTVKKPVKVVKRWDVGRKDLDPYKETSKTGVKVKKPTSSGGAKVKIPENQGATPGTGARVSPKFFKVLQAARKIVRRIR